MNKKKVVCIEITKVENRKKDKRLEPSKMYYKMESKFFSKVKYSERERDMCSINHKCRQARQYSEYLTCFLLKSHGQSYKGSHEVTLCGIKIKLLLAYS
jgi:hypothetical protein